MGFKVTITGMDSLQRKIKKFDLDMDKIVSAGLEDIAGRIEKEAKRLTPKGKYLGLIKRAKRDNVAKDIKKGSKMYSKSGKVMRSKALRKSGNLKDSWKILPIVRKNKVWSIAVTNELFYGKFIEYGHKSRSGSWVPGIFMLKKAVNKIGPKKYSIMRKNLNKIIKESGFN